MSATVAILLSGRGSNAAAILGRAAEERWPAEFLVVSNVVDAPGLRLSEQFAVRSEALPSRGVVDREAYDASLAELLLRHGVQWVILAGFMRILGPSFLRRFPGKVLNIHPSLLPRHRGLHTHQSALDAGDREHGCTVHLVDEKLDAGPILAQSVVPVRDGDDAERLAARVLEAEHRLYPDVVRSAILGRLFEDHPPRPQVEPS